jgi:hypothetical protein
LLIMIEPCSCRTNKNQCSIKMIWVFTIKQPFSD